MNDVRHLTRGLVHNAGCCGSPRHIDDGGTAALDAVVVSGSVTCQIVVGGTVVAEGTSSGGPLSCSAEIE